MRNYKPCRKNWKRWLLTSLRREDRPRSMRRMLMCLLTKKSTAMSQGAADRLERIVYLLRVRARRLLPLMGCTINVQRIILKGIDDHHRCYPRLVGRELPHDNLLPIVARPSPRYMK